MPYGSDDWLSRAAFQTTDSNYGVQVLLVDAGVGGGEREGGCGVVQMKRTVVGDYSSWSPSVTPTHPPCSADRVFSSRHGGDTLEPR